MTQQYLFVSPSTQENNPVAGGGTEEQYMRAICTEACRLLVSAGHLVKMGGSVSWQANVQMANAWQTEALVKAGRAWYCAVHSNAGGGHGTEAFYYTGSTKGKALATTVYKRVAAASNEPDRGVKANTTFGELRGPRAPACLVETLFHDCPKEAAELKASIKEFGLAIAQGILDTCGGSIPVPLVHPWYISSQSDRLIVLRNNTPKAPTGYRIADQSTGLLALRR